MRTRERERENKKLRRVLIGIMNNINQYGVWWDDIDPNEHLIRVTRIYLRRTDKNKRKVKMVLNK